MNCAEQQKTVGLRATRSKALESGSKLLGFQCCEARGQAPPLKVASVPVRKRCLIASVQYPTVQPKSNRRFGPAPRRPPVEPGPATFRASCRLLMTVIKSGAAVLLLSFAILITACGPTSVQYGTVAGDVVVPYCPGLTYPGKACPSRPSPGIEVKFVDLVTNNSAVAVTDSTGHYVIRLPAGRYQVNLEVGALTSHGPRQITVEGGREATASFSYEVGTG